MRADPSMTIPCTIGKILQMALPKMKLRFILATIVNGMKHARKRSAIAKFAKYLSLVSRTGPREANITDKAATLPIKATVKMSDEMPLMIHSALLTMEPFIGIKREALRRETDWH